MDSEGGDVLLAPEAEALVQSLEKVDVEEVGGSRWSIQHEYLEKLNMQAVICATQERDEYVKEFLINHEKLPNLVFDVIVTEVWRQRIFPQILELEPNIELTFPLYVVLYHEATIANLLETVLYHSDALESVDDTLLDLLDYCYRKLVYLTETVSESAKIELMALKNDYKDSPSNSEELLRQEKILSFEIAMKAISVIRYFTDHIESLPVSVTTRMLNTYDIPILLQTLLENPPWNVEKDGDVYRFIDSSWQKVDRTDQFQLIKVAGQVWISIYQLLMNQECQRKYDLNSYRLGILLKLRSHLNEVLIDQMPALGELRRCLENLALAEPPPPKQQLILESVPEIYSQLNKRSDWKELARRQLRDHFKLSREEMQKRAQNWAATYNLDILETLAAEPPKCAECGAAACKRCSRCQNEWYCGRECQVANWKKHKPLCDMQHAAKNL